MVNCAIFHMLLACVLVVCILKHFDVGGLRLGAFNVHRLGPNKAAKEDVMDILAKIAARYDILLVQEITDASGKAILKLLRKIRTNHGIIMNMSISNRLGRSSYKEEYAFLYRKDRGVLVLDSFEFDDGDEALKKDTFMREPYIVRFQASNSRVSNFSLVALHTQPKNTVEELKVLSQVVEAVRDRWGSENIMILGDLNADCSSMSSSNWHTIALKNNTDFWWAIGDNVDTTVSKNTDCAYDRFILKGKELKDAVIASSVQAFDFHAHYNLSYDKALNVSDHYPIELTLQDRSPDSTEGPPRSRASRRSSIMEVPQQAWKAVVRSFSRWRADSDLQRRH